MVDVENCCGTGLPSAAAVEAMFLGYRSVAAVGLADHGVASASRSAIGRIVFSLLPQLRWVPGGSGPDAADLALLGAVDEGHVARRYQRLVIASGDHAFAPLAGRMAATGMEVVVVALRGGLNRELASAATRIAYLPAAASEPVLPPPVPLRRAS